MYGHRLVRESETPPRSLSCEECKLLRDTPLLTESGEVPTELLPLARRLGYLDGLSGTLTCKLQPLRAAVDALACIPVITEKVTAISIAGRIPFTAKEERYCCRESLFLDNHTEPTIPRMGSNISSAAWNIIQLLSKLERGSTEPRVCPTKSRVCLKDDFSTWANKMLGPDRYTMLSLAGVSRPLAWERLRSLLAYRIHPGEGGQCEPFDTALSNFLNKYNRNVPTTSDNYTLFDSLYKRAEAAWNDITINGACRASIAERAALGRFLNSLQALRPLNCALRRHGGNWVDFVMPKPGWPYSPHEASGRIWKEINRSSVILHASRKGRAAWSFQSLHGKPSVRQSWTKAIHPNDQSIQCQQAYYQKQDDFRPEPISSMEKKDVKNQSVPWRGGSFLSGLDEYERSQLSISDARSSVSEKFASGAAPSMLRPTLQTFPEEPMYDPQSWNSVRLGNSPLTHQDAHEHFHGDCQRLVEGQTLAEHHDPGSYGVSKMGEGKTQCALACEGVGYDPLSGDIIGPPSLSEICTAHAMPVSAVWCSCKIPERRMVRPLLLEGTYAPPGNNVLPEWRGEAHPKDRVEYTIRGPCQIKRAKSPRERRVNFHPTELLERCMGNDELWQNAKVRLAVHEGKWVSKGGPAPKCDVDDEIYLDDDTCLLACSCNPPT